MRVVSVALACTLLPSIASAESNPQNSLPQTQVDKPDVHVVGGMDSPAGKWPDTAAVLFGGQQQCTGTLIAPTVALTAAHCNDSSLNAILVDTNSLNRRAEGETLTVTKRVALNQADITVLVLAQPSRVTPRPIATGWAKLDIKNGAPVAIVGYGAIDTGGNNYTADLQEAMSTITDFDCSVKPGCDNFELGAGGMGIDSCFGDSGGPLYLVTDYGNFLVGVTSRGYAGGGAPCGGGGIYGRPDQLIDAIEQAAGVPVTKGPEPALDAQLLAVRGDAGEAQIVHNDPKGTAHNYTITTQPMKGTAAVRADGVLRVCVNADATPGDTDSVVVTVTDQADPNRSVAKRFTVSVAANEPVGGTCDPNAFESSEEGGGCCDSGGQGAGGAGVLSLFALVALRRRRR